MSPAIILLSALRVKAGLWKCHAQLTCPPDPISMSEKESYMYFNLLV